MKKITVLFVLFACHFLCQAQTKKIEISSSDSMIWYKWTKPFNSRNNLIDLTKSKDSLFIRIKTESIFYINSIYEIRYSHHQWQAREITYQKINPMSLSFSCVMLNRNHIYSSHKRKTLLFFEQTCLIPFDSSGFRRNWSSISSELSRLNLFQIKTKNEADTFRLIIDDGIGFEIEFSTPDTYKFISWSNPSNASISYSQIAVQRLYNLVTKMLHSKGEYFPYKKNKWPR